jgi:uncharacterized protein with ParB-like and HNH nuclease domain
MNANSKFITSFLGNPDLQFVIPVYQRNYDWSNDNCEQLWEDLNTIATTNKNSHFMGALVTIYNSEGGDKEYIIIDGQQRLTTISLLLLALHDSMGENEVKSDFDKEQIMDQYLLNKYSDKRRIKLKPIHKDNEAFISLFEGETISSDSNVFKNYDFFKKKIKDMKITPKQLFESIKKLEVVEIEVKSADDNPQLIFESINSTGKDLSEADLVRNFVLMNLNSKTQEEYYKNYWHVIEKNTDFSVDTFLRDYMTLKERITPSRDKVYRAFKKYKYNNSDLEIRDLLEDLLKFSEYYRRIIKGREEEQKIKRNLDKLNSLDMTVVYPFLLEIWDDWKNDKITSDQVSEILQIVEVFLFRRNMCDVPTNALNKIFMVLGKDLKKLMNSNYTDYVEILKHLLISKKGSQRFPNDEEFVEKIKTRDIYHLQSRSKLHLLQNLENYRNKEEVDLKNLIEEGKVNIEHVMPQTLTSTWRKSLGKNYLQIHDKYLNTLGNLTLTGYNPEMSNKPFMEKRDKENGFKESRFLLNRYLGEQDTWDEEHIVNRGSMLADRALNIWPFFSTDFKPKKDTNRLVGINEEYDFRGQRPESVLIEDKEFKVDSWRGVLLNTLEYFYEIDSEILYNLADSEDRMFSRKKEDLLAGGKITEDLYVEMHLSSYSIISIIRKVLKKYNFDEEKLSIYLRENGNSLS